MPMMLKSISVYKLFGEYDYEITLSEERITFIHSQNGFGKSTLMKMIDLILEGDLDTVQAMPFERLDLGFDDDTCLIVENDREELLVQMQKNEVEEEISAEELKSILKVTYIPPERLGVIEDGCIRPALEVYAEELSDKLKEAAENNTLRTVSGKKQAYSDAELEFRCKDLKAKLDFMKQAGFEPDMPPGYRFPPSRFEIMEYRKDYEELAESVNDYISGKYCLAESVIVFMDIVNSIFINKNISVNEKNILTIKMDNGTSISMDRLSSGEKQILIIFYRLLFQTEPGSLAIIDEPEISLHVSWQQQIGKYFAEIAKLRELHILVATHAPSIIHDNWDLAVELKA